jgi:tripartite ATP-independent transporter DctP family solute receptor
MLISRKFFNVCALILALSACAALAAPCGATQYVMKSATVTGEDAAYSMSLNMMAELVEKYTNGVVKMEVYHNGQLGGEREMVEAVGLGTLESAIVSTGPLPNFVPEFMVFDLPYLVTNRTKAYELLDGPLGASILVRLEPMGIRAMSYWENGFRQITNNKKEIKHPSDLKGMKLRTMENEVHMEIFKSLGAIPTPMSITDFQTAIRQGTVDGHENALTNIYSFKLYEAQKFMTMSNHLFSPAVFIVNKEFYESLPPDARSGLDRAEAEVRMWERNYCADLDKELVRKMTALGVTFTEVDRKEWVEATKGVYDTFKNTINQEYVKAFLDIRD